jgi:hypothetical protein
MEITQCEQQLKQNARRLAALVQDVDERQARWRPDPASWSILEVACHLLEEEQKDFRVRLDITLHRPDEKWPAIDPQGWVTAHAYNEQDLEATLAQFRAERQASLTWLAGLQGADWAASYDAPWGPIRAGDLLVAWAAHDLLHMRQLVELLWAYQESGVAPYNTRYAGDW